MTLQCNNVAYNILKNGVKTFTILSTFQIRSVNQHRLDVSIADCIVDHS